MCMFKWIFLGIYVLGLLLLTGSLFIRDKKISRRLAQAALPLVLSRVIYLLVSLARGEPSGPTSYNIGYIIIVVFNLIFGVVLAVLSFRENKK